MKGITLSDDLKKIMRNLITDGTVAADIADFADWYTRRNDDKYTVSTKYALKYFVVDAWNHPEKYTEVDGYSIEKALKKMMDEVLATDTGEIIAAEFRFNFYSIPVDYIADVSRFIAEVSSSDSKINLKNRLESDEGVTE